VLPLLLAWAPAAAAGQGISYTTEQAEDGGEAYAVACVACHASELGGGPDAPPLTGPVFASRWSGRPIRELIGLVRGHMPHTFPSLLNDRTYLELVAFVLAENGLPAGAAPLTFATTGTLPLRPR
jgi:mono/diheme cytochrome c family protein